MERRRAMGAAAPSGGATRDADARIVRRATELRATGLRASVSQGDLGESARRGIARKVIVRKGMVRLAWSGIRSAGPKGRERPVRAGARGEGAPRPARIGPRG